MSSIGRPCHSLKREKTLVMPRHILLFDTETHQKTLPDGSVEQTLKLGWAVLHRRSYGRHTQTTTWAEFTSPERFWTFCLAATEPKRKLWVVAHQLAFDFTIIEGWKYLRQNGYKLKFFHSSGGTCIISVRGNGRSIVFIDSLNWFPESIESLGDRLGIPKLKIDFETTSDSFLSVYCKRDLEILLAAVKDFIKFLEANKVSRLCYTRASTAMAAYLLGCYHKQIYIHNNEQAIALERAAYKGGRCECFFLGELKNDDYYVLDVNSLYSTVMFHGLYPVKYEKILHRISCKDLQRALTSKSGIARVLIETDEPAYAVRRERCIFPVGRFWTTLTTPEIRYAIDNNHLVEIKEAVIYKQADIFSHYVKRFYGIRQEFKKAGVKTYDVFCKYLLNSLYGKFGQKAEVWKKIGVCPGEPDRVELCFQSSGGRVKQIRYLLGEIWELTGYEESFNSFPAIAAHVTAYGRLYLWQLIKKAGLQNCFYCDTDSLIVNESGYSNLLNLVDDTVLGKLKLEHQSRWALIRGLKDYQFGDIERIKGISKKAVKVSDGIYEQEVWPSLKGLLRSNETDSYIVKKQRKVLQRIYTKGTVTESGWIQPLDLADGQQSFAGLF